MFPLLASIILNLSHLFPSPFFFHTLICFIYPLTHITFYSNVLFFSILNLYQFLLIFFHPLLTYSSPAFFLSSTHLFLTLYTRFFHLHILFLLILIFFIIFTFLVYSSNKRAHHRVVTVHQSYRLKDNFTNVGAMIKCTHCTVETDSQMSI